MMTSSHHNVEILGSSTKITIATPRPWIQISILGTMLLFIAVFVPFITSKPGLSPVRIIIVGFMMLWEAWGIFHFCKLLLGKEIIEVGKDFILVSSRVIGFTRAKKYSTKLIRESQGFA